MNIDPRFLILGIDIISRLLNTQTKKKKHTHKPHNTLVFHTLPVKYTVIEFWELISFSRFCTVLRQNLYNKRNINNKYKVHNAYVRPTKFHNVIAPLQLNKNTVLLREYVLQRLIKYAKIFEFKIIYNNDH